MSRLLFVILVCLLEYNCRADPILITAHAGRPIATDPPCDETTGDYKQVSSDWPNCTKNYIECKNGKIKNEKCWPLRVFDPRTLTCRWKIEVYCDDLPKNNINYNCKGEKGVKFPDPNDQRRGECGRYFECDNNGNINQKRCWFSQYDSKKRKCVAFGDCRKFDPTTPQPPTTTTTKGPDTTTTLEPNTTTTLGPDTTTTKGPNTTTTEGPNTTTTKGPDTTTTLEPNTTTTLGPDTTTTLEPNTTTTLGPDTTTTKGPNTTTTAGTTTTTTAGPSVSTTTRAAPTTTSGTDSIHGRIYTHLCLSFIISLILSNGVPS